MFVLTIFCCFGATVVFTFKRIVKVIRYQKIHQLSIHCFIQVSEGLRGTGIFGIFIALWILNYFKAPQWRLEKIGKLFEKNYENYQYYIFIARNCLIIIVFVFKNVLIFWQQINKLMQLSCLRIPHIWGQSISMASAVAFGSKGLWFKSQSGQKWKNCVYVIGSENIIWIWFTQVVMVLYSVSHVESCGLVVRAVDYGVGDPRFQSRRGRRL